MSTQRFSRDASAELVTTAAPGGSNHTPHERVGDPTCASSSKGRRHVAFLLERDLEEERGGGTTRVIRSRHHNRTGFPTPAEELSAWSGRAEADALRERVMQCGENFARVASDLGYEVVAHTPTAFLKSPSNSGVVAAADDVHLPQSFPRGRNYPNGVVGSLMEETAAAGTMLAVPRMDSDLCPLPQRLCASYMQESCASSSCSSSLCTEDQVANIPVLSPAVQMTSEDVENHFAAETMLPLPESDSLVRHSIIHSSHYSDTPSMLQNGSNDTAPSDVLVGAYGSVRSHNSPRSPHPEEGQNTQYVGSVNLFTLHATPLALPPSVSMTSPSPQQEQTPRSAFLIHSHLGAVNDDAATATSPSALLFAPRTMPSTGAVEQQQGRVGVHSGRSSAGSLSTSDMNSALGVGPAGSQSTNRLHTPSTNVLNTPAVQISVVNEEVWSHSEALSSIQ